MTRAPLRIKPAEPAIKSAAASVVAVGPGGISSGDTPGGSNRLIEASDLVTIRVWLSEESGGSLTPEATVPHSTINRIIYPILAGRNPDSFNNLRTNDEWVRSMRDKIGGGSGGGTTTTGNGAGAGKRGGSPGTGSRPAARPNRLPSKGPNP